MELGLPISSAARQLGIDPETLRSWQRRYGLGASSRSAGGHRRYTGADLARLRHARDLIAAGLSTAEAARVVLASNQASFALELPSESSRPSSGEPAHRDVGLSPDAHPGPTVTAGLMGAAEQPHTPPPPDVALFTEAALSLDGALLASLLAAHLDRNGSYRTWEALLRPAFRAVDSCDADRAQRIAAEHLLSHLTSAALLTRAAPRTPGPLSDTARPTRRSQAHLGRVVLACTPTEQHSLPLLALSATLADDGIPTLMLGARTPVTVLRRLANTPYTQEQQVIVLFALRAGAANPALLAPGRNGLTWIAAGPGWDPRPVPVEVRWANGLAATAEAVSAALPPLQKPPSPTSPNASPACSPCPATVSSSNSVGSFG
ncbi:MerR family transcriptional regulator [Pseudonocardia halophobica]|uniref:MerR family transcriptional regulator n=1 Tax=Pseudonocardia halophobica TaxID=29401 RepID=UPI003D89CE79